MGPVREVDVLKGVNMAYRRTAIKGMHFDERMRGTGAQVHFELAFTLPIKRAGWKIIFDPLVAVDHYLAVRFDEDQRYIFNDIAWSNTVHNETLVLLEHFAPMQRITFLLWAILDWYARSFRHCPVLKILAQRRRISPGKNGWHLCGVVLKVGRLGEIAD